MPRAAKRFSDGKKNKTKRKWDASIPCRAYHHLYGNVWRDMRASYLAAHPLCVECKKGGRCVVATVVDHVERHEGNPDLFYDSSNLQSLCKPCHDRKTWQETRGVE